VPRLPPNASVIGLGRSVLGVVPRFFDRDLLEQSVTERLARAVFVIGLLWLAVYWAL
jgi:hypothetical protein